jgi:Phage tail protein E.
MSDIKTSDPITLQEPITRGTQTIKEVSVRKPKSGELRGVKLADLFQMDVAALEVVLPRITSPRLEKHDVANLDPGDLSLLAMEVVDFLVPTSKREQFLAA